MAQPNLHKGYFGVDYRSQIGLHRTSGGTTDIYIRQGDDPSWDLYVGPLPFLVANNDDRPYLRETTSARRERLDQAREPGENSLDSAIWLRSQTSWHLGAGQQYAEPLEEDPEIARFRFYRSGGVNPWVPGSLSLLPETAQRDTGARHCFAVDGVGVLVSTNSAGVRKYPLSGASTQLSTKTVTKLAANAARWFGFTSTSLDWGDTSGATGEGTVAKSGITAVHWGKDRLWVGVGAEFHEITAATPTFGTATYTFRNGTIADIDTGSGGGYILLNSASTSIYVVTVKDDGTLNVPREVATLPKGETGNFLYSYLGRYLIIGTNKGIRVADASVSTELPIGPLIEVTGGVLDAVGDSNFIWYTAGTGGIVPDLDATAIPGLYRMDLSRQISSVSAYGDSAAAKYPYAADMTAATTGQAYSVTSFSGKIFFVAGTSATDSPLWQQQDTLVDYGWYETGQISFSTAERKTWMSFGVEVSGDGYHEVQANTGAGYSGVTQSAVAVPYVGDHDVDSQIHAVSGWMSYRVRLIGTGTGAVADSPTVLSMTLRSTPAPKRTRYIKIPLYCHDRQIDRNNNPIGYDGFGYDRLMDLESLEERGGLITVVDQRTGESKRCQIERISYEGTTPPSRNYPNFGGIVTVTLLTV